MIFPSGFVEEFSCAFRIVGQRLDVGIEILRIQIDWRDAYLAETQADILNDLLAIDQHRHRLPHSLVFEERRFVVPKDYGLTGNRILDLGKLLVECRTS